MVGERASSSATWMASLLAEGRAIQTFGVSAAMPALRTNAEWTDWRDKRRSACKTLATLVFASDSRAEPGANVQVAIMPHSRMTITIRPTRKRIASLNCSTRSPFAPMLNSGP